MYSRAFGVRSVQDGSENEPLSVDSVMYVASCTKLLTTVAALQCVERGLVTLDDDLRPIVHELQDLDILQGGGNGGMVSKRKNTAPITLRYAQPLLFRTETHPSHGQTPLQFPAGYADGCSPPDSS